MTPEQIATLLADVRDLKDKVDSLEADVKNLEEWKRARERQQLSEPLDYPSQKIVKRAAA